MTRERFEQIREEWEKAVAYRPSFTDETTLVLWGETIAALEQAWIERDVNAMELEATISERDEALKESLALTVEKEGMQILIDELHKGHDRYEIARRLRPSQWADVWTLNITTGKRFDEIIDDLRPFVGPNEGEGKEGSPVRKESV